MTGEATSKMGARQGRAAAGAAERRGSAGNAFKHGLSARILTERDRAKIEEVAGLLLGEAPREALVWDAACAAAEAHLEVLRVEAERLRRLEAAEASPSPFIIHRKVDAKIILTALKRGFAGVPTSGRVMQDFRYRHSGRAPRDINRRQVRLLRYMADDLLRIDRYISSARARRRQALRELDRVRCTGVTEGNGR